MTSTTSSVTRLSSLMRGIGSGQPRGTLGRRGRPDGLLHLGRAGRGGVPLRAASRSQGPDVPPAARAGADDPQARRQAPSAGHPDRAGPGGASRPQDGARADLRGGLPAVSATASARSAEPRTPSPRSTTSRSRSYEWVLEGDIKACFDEIDHTALMDRVRRRIGDKRVLGLVKAFLKAGILGEDGDRAGHEHRHPAGRDPLTAAGQHRPVGPRRSLRRGLGGDGRPHRHAKSVDARDWPTTASSATRTTSWCWWPAPAPTPKRLRDEVAAVLRPMGLRLSEEKTRIVHIDEGFDFLGFRIQRHQKRGTGKRFVYTYPSKKALWPRSRPRCGAMTRGATNQSLAVLLHRLNPVLRGWTNYFRHGRVQGDLQLPARLHLATGGVLAPPQAPPRSAGGGSDGATSQGGGRRTAR